MQTVVEYLTRKFTAAHPGCTRVTVVHDQYLTAIAVHVDFPNTALDYTASDAGTGDLQPVMRDTMNDGDTFMHFQRADDTDLGLTIRVTDEWVSIVEYHGHD